MPGEIRCTATNSDGTPCRAPSNLIDERTRLCRSHDPQHREAILEAAAKGGQATARRFHADGLSEDELPPLKSPQDAARRLDLIGQAIGTGRLGHQEGRAMVGAVQQWLKAHEIGDMADQVGEIRQQLAKAKGTKLERLK